MHFHPGAIYILNGPETSGRQPHAGLKPGDKHVIVQVSRVFLQHDNREFADAPRELFQQFHRLIRRLRSLHDVHHALVAVKMQRGEPVLPLNGSLHFACQIRRRVRDKNRFLGAQLFELCIHFVLQFQSLRDRLNEKVRVSGGFGGIGCDPYSA